MKILIAIFFLNILLVACNNNYNNNLEIAEKIIEENPDSALSILKMIEISNNNLNDSSRAKYGLLLCKAHEKTGNSLIEDSIIIFSKKYYEQIKDTAKMQECYSLLANYYFRIKQKDSAELALQKGLQLSIKRNDNDQIATFYRRLAKFYNSIGSSEKSIMAMKGCIIYRNNASDNYNLGVRLVSENKDSGEYYVTKGIEMALASKDFERAAFFQRNYAMMYLVNNQSKEALTAINRIPKSNLSKEEHQVACIITSIAHLQLGQVDSANVYLKRIEQAKIKGSSTFENLRMLVHNICIYTKNREFDFLSISRYNDSLVNEMDLQKRDLSARIEAKNKLNQQNLELINERQRTQIYALIFLVIVIILGTVVLLYIKRKKYILIESEERAETLQSMLNEATRQNNNDIINFKTTILQQLNIIQAIATNPSHQNQQILKSTLQWDSIYPMIDVAYNNYYSKLMMEYGSILDDRDVQLCCLIRAGYSTKEISIIIEQSTRTIYNRKSGIRKKIGIDENIDISSLFDNK